MFGFVESPINDSIKEWERYFGQDSSTQSKQFGAYVPSTYFSFQRHGCEQHHSWTETQATDKWKLGDKFGMRIDFEARTIALVYNGKDIGVMYKNIPNKLHATMNVYRSAEFRCTKYKLIP